MEWVIRLSGSLCCGGLGVLVLLGSVASVLRARRLRRLVSEGTVSKIADARPGTVLLRGRLGGSSLVTAPLEAGPVLAFHFKVIERILLPKPRARTIVDDKQFATGVTLTDESGQIGVPLGGDHINLVNKLVDGNSNVLKEPPKGLAEALAHYERSTTGLFLNRTLSWTLHVLLPDSEVTLLGEVVKGEDGALSLSKDELEVAQGEPRQLVTRLSNTVHTSTLVALGTLVVAPMFVVVWWTIEL